MNFKEITKKIDILKNIDPKNINEIQETIHSLAKDMKILKPQIQDTMKKSINLENRLYQIWTDGACSCNPGIGGWAALIRIKSKTEQEEIKISGNSPKTTNNIMELTSALEALKKIPRGGKVQIFTDSQYLRRGMLEWLANWKKRGWKKSNGKPVLNVDLWKKLDQQKEQKNIEWYWVKGHSKIAENELCDELARQEIAKLKNK